MHNSLYDIPLQTISGEGTSLGAYQGKVLLIVNVASRCGLTPQYEGLEALYRTYRDQGLVVLGFPANDFASQEPGTNAEIDQFCRTNYGIDFPIFAKLKVVGEDRHPLYTTLIAAQPEPVSDDAAMRERLSSHGMTPNPAPEILWNFEKFVVGRNGKIVARFAPDTSPDNPKLIESIESELVAGLPEEA